MVKHYSPTSGEAARGGILFYHNCYAINGEIWMYLDWRVGNFTNPRFLTLSEPALFWVSHEPGGGVDINPPLLFQPWGIWEIGDKHDFCDDFSEDYFEVHYISVAQNLTILETNMRFCWKSQKIRTIF